MDSEEEEEDKGAAKGPFFQTVHEYAEVATTHGIYYIFESGRLVLERVFWVIVVILALLFAIGLSVSAYDNWKANPVLTSVGTTGYPIEKVAFPSITICPQGSANEIVDAALFKQFHHYLAAKNKKALELSEKEMQEEGKNFLLETYPGAQQAPTQMIRMLGSPGMDPDKSMEAEAILNPEDQEKCLHENKTETLLKCPDGFVNIANYTDKGWPCWHFHDRDHKRSKAEASDYCNNLVGDDEFHLFVVRHRLDWEVLWNILNTGTHFDSIQLAQ